MRYFQSLVLILLGITVLGAIQNPEEVKPVPEQIIHRPTAVPDRIILTWDGDPAKSQAVTWRTDTSVAKAIAQIAVADASPKLTEKATLINAVSTPLKSDLSEAHYHAAKFENLQPDTRYAYRVGDGVNWSEWMQFRTAKDKPAPFSFIYFGDAQNDIKSLWSRVIREAYTDAPRAAFIIHAGDLINRANRDAEWGEWYYSAGWVNGMVPSIPSPGNHEYEVTNGVRGISRHWKPQFTLPQNGLPGLEESVYYVDYQGARIICLNSNERQAEQVEWINKVLTNNPNRWTVITFHHPLYSTAKGRDNAELRQMWKPLFDKHQVDIVLQGHDHSYARGNLKTGLVAQSGETGTMYVVSVSGPKQYNLERKEWMQRAAENTQLYQVITINGDKLHFEAKTATGQLYDAFELIKQPKGTNRLRDLAPKDVPERRTLPVK